MINFLNKLTKEELNKCELKQFKKGSTIFFEGDNCTSIGVVISGLVSIRSYSSNSEITYNVIKTNECFGNNLIFSSDTHYRGNVICELDSSILFIKKDQLVNYLKSNTEFLEAFLMYQDDFTKNLNFQIKILSISSVRERIIYYFSLNNNKLQIKSISMLAKRLFLSREATSREFHSLIKQGIIKKNKDSYHLDIEKINKKDS